ncbi:hypothetical protein Taro_022860, partial [Colocasia esculenta]|nr:hypothetical protein [Colocasia esculenta]
LPVTCLTRLFASAARIPAGTEGVYSPPRAIREGPSTEEPCWGSESAAFDAWLCSRTSSLWDGKTQWSAPESKRAVASLEKYSRSGALVTDFLETKKIHEERGISPCRLATRLPAAVAQLPTSGSGHWMATALHCCLRWSPMTDVAASNGCTHMVQWVACHPSVAFRQSSVWKPGRKVFCPGKHHRDIGASPRRHHREIRASSRRLDQREGEIAGAKSGASLRRGDRRREGRSTLHREERSALHREGEIAGVKGDRREQDSISLTESIHCARPFGEQSSVSDNVIHTSKNSGNVSEEMRLRSDLWHDLIHSSNQTFSSVEQLRMDLNRYAISRAFDYHFIRNEQTRVTVTCKVVNCQWSLYAIRIGCGPQFKIKSLNNVHTCGGGLSTQRHPRATKKSVSSIVHHYIVLYILRKISLGNMVLMCLIIKHGLERMWRISAFMVMSGVHLINYVAIPRVFPTSYNAFCLRHLQDNFAKHLRGKCSLATKDTLLQLLSQAAYALRVVDFEKVMREMRELNVQAEIWARESNPNYWSNTFFEGERYGEMYSNAAESFNAWLLEARHLPILAMMDRIRIQIMELSYKRRNKCVAWETRLCPKIDTYVKNLMDSSRGIHVNCSNDIIFEVISRPSHVVDLHEVVHKIGGNVEEYCSMYFTTECYSNCYKETIHPISDVDKPDTIVDDIEIKPPATKRKSSRPKKKRIPSQQALEGEKMTYTCSRCKEKGHNQKSYSNPIADWTVDKYIWYFASLPENGASAADGASACLASSARGTSGGENKKAITVFHS